MAADGKKKADPSSTAGRTGEPAKPVLDAVIETVSALSELAKSLRARAREAAAKETRAKTKGKGKKGARKSKSASAPASAAAATTDVPDTSETTETSDGDADAKPDASDRVRRRLKKAWADLTGPEAPEPPRT